MSWGIQGGSSQGMKFGASFDRKKGIITFFKDLKKQEILTMVLTKKLNSLQQLIHAQVVLNLNSLKENIQKNKNKINILI